MELQLTNVGQSPIVVKDQQGYTDFAVSVEPATTEERDISRDLLQRLTPYLKALETPVLDDYGNILVALQWGVVASATADDRAMGEGLAGLPALNELQLAGYSTGTPAADVVATGTGLLGNQVKATLEIAEGAVQLDLEAVTPGAGGNAITCEVIIGSGLAVAVVGNAIAVTLPAIGDSVADIRDAINAHAAAKLLVQATEGAAGDLTVAVAATALAGGTGPGVSLALGGTALAITALTDIQVNFATPGGISTDTYHVPLEYRNGPHVSRLSVPVIA